MPKALSEQTFNIGNGLTIECRSERTRYGFRHMAVARMGLHEVAKSKACYYNRTWERFEFESVIRGVASRLPKNQGAEVLAFCDKHREPNRLAPVAAVMGLLGLLAKGQAEANAAQTRILKTVPGIDLPADWDGLPEDVKAKRLAGVQKVMREP
jgi:hypothetical protein